MTFYLILWEVNNKNWMAKVSCVKKKHPSENNAFSLRLLYGNKIEISRFIVRLIVYRRVSTIFLQYFVKIYVQALEKSSWGSKKYFIR